jgi:hypothetical protein
MINEIKNIDKFFRDLFENFRVKPYRDTWDKISDALDNTDPKDALIPDVDEIGTLFKGYRVTPSERVWQNIYKILESDKFAAKRLSKGAISAIIAFFNKKAATIIASVVIITGVSLLFINPFKHDSSKVASLESVKHITTPANKVQSAVKNQNENTASIHSEAVNSTSYNLKPNSAHNTEPANTENNLLSNLQESQTFASTTPPETVNSIKNQSAVNTHFTIVNNIPESNTIKNNQIASSDNTNKNNLLTKYPSVKFKIRQGRYRYSNGRTVTIDIRRTLDKITYKFSKKIRFSHQPIKGLFYFEALYLPIYGTSTYIADQKNTSTMERSYNEYLNGNPTNGFGINLGFSPNRYLIEIGALYQDRYTRRVDNLNYISYDTNITFRNDSIGTVYNAFDNSYHTIYDIVPDTSYQRHDQLKTYRTRMNYKTIDVPLLIGYKLVYKKSTLAIKTGVLASFIFKSVEESTNIDPVRQYITYPEKQKVELSWAVNMSYDFNISNNLKVTLTPTLRYNVTGLYKGYSINARPFTYGMGLGLKYIF